LLFVLCKFISVPVAVDFTINSRLFRLPAFSPARLFFFPFLMKKRMRAGARRAGWLSKSRSRSSARRCADVPVREHAKPLRCFAPPLLSQGEEYFLQKFSYIFSTPFLRRGEFLQKFCLRILPSFSRRGARRAGWLSKSRSRSSARRCADVPVREHAKPLRRFAPPLLY